MNGGTLTIASTGSIVGNLTVNPGGSFVNNGTVNTPGVVAGSTRARFTNSNAFLGNLANAGTATNTGTLTGSVINGAAGSFANNGTVTGQRRQHGRLVGQRQRRSATWPAAGVMAPGNSIGTMTVTGNFTQTSARHVYLTEVAARARATASMSAARRRSGRAGDRRARSPA